MDIDTKEFRSAHAPDNAAQRKRINSHVEGVDWDVLIGIIFAVAMWALMMVVYYSGAEPGTFARDFGL
jgi:hypothetical protein